MSAFISRALSVMRTWCVGLIVIAGAPGLMSGAESVLRVGVEGGRRGALSFVDEQGRPSGFAPELLQAVTRVGGPPIEIVPGSWTNILGQFQDGKLDVLANVAITEERRRTMDFSIPHATMHGVAYFRQGGPVVRSTADLAGKKIGGVTGTLEFQNAQRNAGWGGMLVAMTSVDAGLDAVSNGTCDVLLLTRRLSEETLRQRKLRSEFLDDVVHEFRFAVHKGDAAVLARLNDALATLRSNGTFDELYTKWIGPVEPHPVRLADLRPYFLPAAAVLVAVVFVIGWQRRMLRQREMQSAALRESEEAVRRLNAELERRVEERTAELGARIAEVERLYGEQQELMRSLKLSEQMADRTAARLQESNSNLLAANQELEAFSYSVSHDLRAPLRNITGFMDLLKRRGEVMVDEDAKRFLTIIATEVQRMGDLIEDLLTFSRVGRAEMKREPVNLAELLVEVRESLTPEVDGRTIEWKVGALPVVIGDRALLRQVVTNLLSNAAKFTRRRERAVIEIGAAPVPAGQRGVAIFVRDNGVGFNPRYLDRLFGVFQRLHSSRDFEGSGIGLANVKRIVTRHGGRVWAEGQIDQGATFWFTLEQGATS